jgi:O-antigen/teichoic acid export membrane protein
MTVTTNPTPPVVAAEPPGSGRRPIARIKRSATIVTTVGTGLANQLMLALSGPLVARMLGVQARGEVALIFVVSAIASQISFGGGLPPTIAHQLARRGVTGRDGLRRIAPKWVLPSIAPSVVAGVVIYVAVSGPATTRLELAVITALLAFSLIWYLLLIGVLQGEGSFRRLNILRIFPQMLNLAVLTVVFVLYRSWSVIPVMLLMLGLTIGSVVIGYRMLKPPTDHPGDELDPAELWSDARRTFVSATGPLDGLGIDQALVGLVLGQVLLGLYACATSLANLSTIVSRSIALMLLPRVTMSVGDPAVTRSLVRRWLMLSIAANITIVTVVEVLCGPVIRIAFGAAFVGAIPAAHVLIAADGLLGFRRVLIAVLQGQGRGGSASLTEAACLPLLIGGIAIGATSHGLVGVATSVAVMGAIVCVGLGVQIARWQPEISERALVHAAVAELEP